MHRKSKKTREFFKKEGLGWEKRRKDGQTDVYSRRFKKRLGCGGVEGKEKTQAKTKGMRRQTEKEKRNLDEPSIILSFTTNQFLLKLSVIYNGKSERGEDDVHYFM